MRYLFADIETSPMLVYTHYIGSKVSINPVQIKEYKKVICISYAWSDEPISKVHTLKWDKNQDDSKMLMDFNEVAKSADVIIGHNAQAFDIRELRTAIALRGLADAWCETPVFDTLKDYRRMFRLPSNRLDAIGGQLNIGRKNSTDFQLWIDVSNGCKKAMTRMVKYCEQDVKLLRKIHKRLAKYVTPSIKDYNTAHTIMSRQPSECKECGNTLSFIKYGRYTYNKQMYQKWLCKMCGKVNMPEKDRDG